MNILLVDNNDLLLPLKNAFKKLGCKVAHVSKAKLALKALALHKLDAVICVENIGNISGVQLLTAIATKYPTLVRAAIIDEDSEHKISNGICHFVYSMPYSADAISEAIFNIADNNAAITKDVIVRAVNKIKTLPSPPRVYFQINAMLEAKDTDSDKVAKIIAQDPALTAKVMQVSNNTFASKGKGITSISEAITKLGLETLSYIVMTAEMFAYEPNIEGYSLEDEQQHSFATAKLAASMVKPEHKQNAMLAGLLHDIGKLVLLELDPELSRNFFQFQIKNADNYLLEKKIFSTDHCHVGGYLLHRWSFSYQLIEAIVLHHQPQKLMKMPFGVAHAVYLANILVKEQQIDETFIEHFKLSGVMPALESRAEALRA